MQSSCPIDGGGGFQVVTDLGFDVLMIVSRYDSAVESHLQSGGTALLIAADETSLPKGWPLQIALRSGTELDGRWFSNFNWIRGDRQPFSAVSFGPILGFESAKVAPSHLIRGIEPEQFEDVISGITFGWLNNNCALAAQMLVGTGKMIVTTYKFHAYGTDPYATELLNSLLTYLSSPNLQPKLKVLPVLETHRQ
jgi:hypothetical protein